MNEHDKRRIEAAAEKRRRKRAAALRRVQAQAVARAQQRGEDVDAALRAATLPGTGSLPRPNPTTPRKQRVRFYPVPRGRSPK